MESVAGSWEGFKSQMASAVKLGESMNMSIEQIEERAAEVGDFLAQRIDANSPEQRVLKELWEVADEEEQHALAGAIIKLVSSSTDVH